MIHASEFLAALEGAGVRFFAGVPDSQLKPFCNQLVADLPGKRHVITANEGAAIALGLGHYIATDQIPLIYMQNSGLGNTVNPITSLVDPEVYGVPMILLVGWRGEPGIHDEPQHVKQGRITPAILDALEIPFSVLGQNNRDLTSIVNSAMESAQNSLGPHAILVRKGVFQSQPSKIKNATQYQWRREDAIKEIIDASCLEDVVVSTTGKASRELFEYREQLGQNHSRDFLTVGGMGHASQIAMGIALQKPERNVICIDGDGAALMHLGSLAIVGTSNLSNFRHIIINNGAHDSVGGHPTVGFQVDFCGVARACGYKKAQRIENQEGCSSVLKSFFQEDGPTLLEIRVDRGSRGDLGRPTTSPADNKRELMGYLK